MPRRAVYVTGWVAVTSAATVIGLGAVGVVRGAVQGNDTVTALSQQQVTEQLQGTAAAPVTTATKPASGHTAAPRQSPQTQPPARSTASHPAAPQTTIAAPPTAAAAAAQSTSAPTTTHSQEPKSTPTPSQSEQSSPAPAPTRSSAPPSAYQAFTSAGGTVFARCQNGNQVSGTATPTNGYRIGEQELGPDSHIKVEFVGNNTKITVQVFCSGGSLTSSVQTGSGD